MIDQETKLSRLIDLKQKLAYVGYDGLSLCHLNLLRNEVDAEVNHIINNDEAKVYEA